MSTVTMTSRGSEFAALWRERLESALKAVVGPVAGFALFVLVWQVVASEPFRMRVAAEQPAPVVAQAAAQ